MTRKKEGARVYVRKQAGDRFGKVTLVRPGRHGHWVVRCDCGTEFEHQTGGLPTIKSCGRGACRWVEVPSYATAHGRVRRAKGKATDQKCERCGAPARAWAYDHKDPGEHLDPVIGSPYSGNPDHYVALCGPCHREDDNAERRALRARIKELEAALAAIRPACGTCNSSTGGRTRSK